MDAAHKRFLKLWLVLTAAALALVVCLNLLVDPPGAYPSVNLSAFESLRYLRQERANKAELARSGKWQVAIIGSSRAKGAMPSAHPFFATNRTCNLSVDAARVPELKAIFDFVRLNSDLEHVILCLDFYMFASGPPTILDFNESRFSPEFAPFRYHCKRLLSKESLDDTWEVLQKKRRGYAPDPQESRGFLKLTLPSVLSQRVLFTNTLKVMAKGYASQKYDPSHLKLVAQIAQVCREKGIRLHIAILPVHALDLEMLHASGRWQDFERWQQQLVDVVSPQPDDLVSLWDFTSFAGQPAEPVPAVGDEKTRMTYYFENSHCTPVLGTNIVNRIIGVPGERFGSRLDKSGIEMHSSELLRQRDQFVASYAADVQWARRIMQEALAQTPRRSNPAPSLARVAVP